MRSKPLYPNPFFFSFVLAASLLLNAASLFAQEPDRYRVMFYNVENLFDTFDDPAIEDSEFLPEGDKHWNEDKFYNKLNHIYKVIISCGEWDPPAVIGLCEVENRKVLEILVNSTPLKKFEYHILHFDSPDRRGIDVALLYRASHFTPDTAYPIPVVFPFDPESKTRDILYVKGRLGDREKLHVFVNHWPSRYGGYQVTIPKRNRAAEVLRKAIDSIRTIDTLANILAMGDFNDGPDEQSMTEYLRASRDTANLPAGNLLNITAIYEDDPAIGTLKYKENWDVFDQLVISPNMLNPGSALYLSKEGARIHQPDFLFEKDEKYLGEKPFRTYAGMKYLGGYSDHLPVFVDLKIR